MTLLSPGIEVKEIDLSTTIANASTGRAATVGKSQWGPAYQISQIPDETDFVRRFGAPNDYTAATFFSATNFLKYGNDLRFVRIVDRLKAKNSTALFNSLNIKITSAGSAYVADQSYPVKAGTETITTATITQVDATTGAVLALRIPTAGIVEAIAAGKTDANLTGVTLELEGKTGTGAVVELKLVTDSGVVLVNDSELHIVNFVADIAGGDYERTRR